MSRMVSVMSRMVSVMSRTGLVMSCTLGLHGLKGFRLFRRQDFFYFRTVRLYGFLPFLVLTGKQGLEFLYLAFVKPEPVLHPFHLHRDPFFISKSFRFRPMMVPLGKCAAESYDCSRQNHN